MNGSRGSPDPPFSGLVVFDEESKESDYEIASTKLKDTDQQPGRQHQVSASARSVDSCNEMLHSFFVTEFL